MERKIILSKLKMQLKKLDKLKEQYSYHENINALQKDLHKVYRCIKNGRL